MWTYPELEVTLPRLLPVDPTWKATASHNAERAASGLTLAAWTTGTPQAPDMWFQVELPQAAMVTEVQFDAGRARWRRPRPRRTRRRSARAGRGGAPGAARRPQRPRPHLERPPVVPPHPRRLSAAPGPAAAAAARRHLAASRLATRCSCRWTARPGALPSREGAGSPATIVATFRPTQAKFVRVTQTGTAENAPAWSVLNFRVYASGGAPAR